MDMLWSALALDHTTRTVLLGAGVLGLVAGVLGCLTTLRRQSLLGDVLAHAALPGVCAAFLVTGSRQTWGLLAGAIVAGLVSTLALLAIVGRTRVREDAALGVVLTVSFGIGTVLLTVIQHRGDAAQGGLDRFLFGQAATLLPADVALMAALGGIVLAAVVLLFKELKLQTFDPGYAQVAGLPVTGLSVALGVLLAVTVAIGLQAVGVILMVSLLIAPAVAARQWTRSLGAMMALAGLFGLLSGVAGTLASARGDGAPTGPAIVLAATAVAVVSVLFAPGRGVVARTMRQRAARRTHLPDAPLTDRALAPVATANEAAR